MKKSRGIKKAIKIYWIIGVLATLISGLIIWCLQFLFDGIEAMARIICNGI